MDKQKLVDWLFRLRLYWGIRMKAPDGLVKCDFNNSGSWVERYALSIDDKHELGDWLLNECAGPWSYGLYRPIRDRKTYIVFARVADAYIFRLKTS